MFNQQDNKVDKGQKARDLVKSANDKKMTKKLGLSFGAKLNDSQQDQILKFAYTTHFKERMEERFGITGNMTHMWLRENLKDAVYEYNDDGNAHLRIRDKIILVINVSDAVFITAFRQESYINVSANVRTRLFDNLADTEKSVTRLAMADMNLFAGTLVDATNPDDGSVELATATMKELQKTMDGFHSDAEGINQLRRLMNKDASVFKDIQKEDK